MPYQTFSKIPLANLSSFQNLNNIVSDGPYTITSYFGSESVSVPGKPILLERTSKAGTMNYYFFTSQASEFNAYVAGQIDALAYPGSYSGIESVANLTGHSLIVPPFATPGLSVQALLNDWVYPTNITGFRRALAFATNATSINSELNGPYANLTASNQDFLLPSYNKQIGFGNETGPTAYSYNVTESKQIMQSIGFKYGGNTLEYPNGTAVSLTIRYRNTEPYSASVATLLSAEWSQIGITVNPIAVPSAVLRAGANNATGWQVIVTGVLGPQTDNGVTPGPGILQDIGDYYVTMNGTHDSWNSTFYAIIQRMILETPNSSKYDADARTAVTMYVQGVPSIPLFNVFNWAAVSNNFYWGNPANSYRDLLHASDYATGVSDMSLDVVAPTSSTSSTTKTTSTIAVSTVTATVSTVSTLSSIVLSTVTSGGSTVVSTVTSSVPTTVVSITATTAASSTSGLLYVGIGVVIVIIVVAAVALMMARKP